MIIKDKENFSEKFLEKNKKKIISLKKKNDELKKKIISLKLKNKKNIKKIQNRCSKKIELCYKFCLEKNIFSVLPILDSLEMAISSINNKKKKYEKICKKLNFLKNYFIKVLLTYNVKIINKINVLFNPLIHQAIFLKNSKTIKKNHVVEIIQKGYLLNDRVLRAAMVSVSKI
ncbi:Protein GrpE [Buchnera aphidicola (Periphyllus testudinaceus)]|uniref:nucleotide exchange factor GrpE n=1 Tax=Buchnera aphidicola TaxID=9 RepID=UPI0034646E3C